MKFQKQIIKEALYSLLQSLELLRTSQITYSPGMFSPRIPNQIVPDILPAAKDIEIAERLHRAYRLSMKDEGRSAKEHADIWSHNRENQPTFFTALGNEDPIVLATYLCNMCRHDATHGTVQGYREYLKVKYNPLYRRYISKVIKDKLVLLAEAVGAVGCENPEQGVWGQNFHLPIDQLVDAIESQIELDITPPAIDGGLLKITGSKAQFNERDLNAIFTAWSMTNKLENFSNASICEIGAGTGRVAYWNWRFGIKSYSIIDLAHINVLQGFYLLKALPDANIRLYGEPVQKLIQDREIAILPTYAINDFSQKQFDLVLNQDSFPEIHANIVRDYLIKIREISRQYFLSINHESCPPGVDDSFTHINVQQLIDEVGGYKKLTRDPYWLRRGYVMELYKV
tara:strand:- start:1091 stop:2287 length:1197 start_codon:yes stop_codon:yes gene_type:complete